MSKLNPTVVSSIRDMRVISGGICCAIGYNAAATNCALRAGLDHFQESEFTDGGGNAIRVARLDKSFEWGSVRQARWLKHAIQESLTSISAEEQQKIPIILMTGDTDRLLQSGVAELTEIKLIRELISHPFPNGSAIVAGGRGAFGRGLSLAHEILSSGPAKKVLVAGLDSYLNTSDITNYLECDRLLTADNSDGFIPGEAAAAIVLEIASDSKKCGGLHIVGWGQANEDGRPDGSRPSRAKGLSAAMRRALERVGLSLSDLAFRISDQNGESFFAKDAANAITRVVDSGGSIPDILTTADCTGEIGAATGPLMLAWMLHYLSDQDAAGTHGMLHLASDEGERCAVIFGKY